MTKKILKGHPLNFQLFRICVLTLQTWGLSFECFCILWLFKSLDWLKVKLHSLHFQGLSERCKILCFFKFPFELKTLPHSSQFKFLTFDFDFDFDLTDKLSFASLISSSFSEVESSSLTLKSYWSLSPLSSRNDSFLINSEEFDSRKISVEGFATHWHHFFRGLFVRAERN